MSDPLQEFQPRYLDRNHFLDMVLGVLSCGRGLQRAVLTDDLPQAEPQTQLDDLVLGLLSFTRNLEHHIEQAQTEAPQSPEAPGDKALGHAARPRDLLL